MAHETSKAESRRCPVCGEGTLLNRVISERSEVEDRGTIVLVETKDVPLEECDFCGESFGGPEAARIRHDAIGRALGLLTPAEIIKIRAGLNLDQAEFAGLIGVRECDVLGWERGRAWHDRVVDNLLRLLATQPDSLLVLQSDRPGVAGDHAAEIPPPGQATGGLAVGR